MRFRIGFAVQAEAVALVVGQVAVEEDLAELREAVEEDLVVADALVVAVRAADSIGISPLCRHWLRSRRQNLPPGQRPFRPEGPTSRS